MRDCGRGFRETFDSPVERVLVMFDTVYAHAIGKSAVYVNSGIATGLCIGADELKELIAEYKNCVVSHLSLPSQESRDSGTRSCHPHSKSCDYSMYYYVSHIVYVGGHLAVWGHHAPAAKSNIKRCIVS